MSKLYKGISRQKKIKLEEELGRKLTDSPFNTSSAFGTRYHSSTSNPDRYNEDWKKSSFWNLPPKYQWVKFKKGFNENHYRLPFAICFSQSFEKFVKNELREKVKGYISGMEKNELIKRKQIEKGNLDNLIEISYDFWKSAKEHFIESIEHDAVPVQSCDPYEDGNIYEMREIIGEAELAYQGGVLGSEFALEHLIINYLSDFKCETYQSTFNDILEHTKKFLALQVAIANFPDHKRDKKRWAFLDNIFDELIHKEAQSDQEVLKILLKYDESLSYRPPKGFFTNEIGKAKKESFAKAFKEIYENTFPVDSISKKAIKDEYDFLRLSV